MIKQEEPIVIATYTFISKLWDMLNNPDYSDVIAWTDSGDSFVISDKEKLIFEVLPRYFKHNNLSSFIRQLNKYGFRKVHSNENTEVLEFAHDNFLRDEPGLLSNVKRKESEVNTLKGLLDKVQSLMKTQEVFQSKVSSMEKQQEILCKETDMLKKKNQVQQKIINNIMSFLVSMVHHNEDDSHEQYIYPNQNNVSCRNLMAITQHPHVNPGEESSFNAQVGKNVSEEEQKNAIMDFLLDSEVDSLQTTPDVINPIVTDREDLIDNESGACGLRDNSQSPYSASPFNDQMQGNNKLDELILGSDNIEMDDRSSPVIIESKNSLNSVSPQGNIASLDLNKLDLLYSSDSNNAETDLPMESSTSELSQVLISPKKEFIKHVDSMDSNIEVIKDIMKDANLSLDINEVMELFTPEELSAIAEVTKVEDMDSD